METLGELLKNARESKSKNLKDISKELKIDFNYLKALEEDRFNEINIPEIYKKGILERYAKYLGVDEKLALNLYNQQYEKPVIEEIKKEEKKEKSLIFLVYIIVAFIIFISIYVAYKYSSKPTPLLSEESYTEEIKIKEETYTLPQVSSSESVQTVSIKLVAKERTWIRAKYEDKIIFEGTLQKGDIKTFTYSYLDLYIGNAGGLEIFYNDKSIGILGKKGEVIRKRIP